MEEPATEVAAERLFSILQDAGVLKDQEMLTSEYEEETNLTWELDSWGDWKRSRVELVRDESVKERLKYNTRAVDICKGSDRPAFVHRLWNKKIAPEHTEFGTLLKENIGYARAGIEVGIAGCKKGEIPVGTNVIQRAQEGASPLSSSRYLAAEVGSQLKFLCEQGTIKLPDLADSAMLGVVEDRFLKISDRLDSLQTLLPSADRLLELEAKAKTYAEVTREQELGKDIKKNIMDLNKTVASLEVKIHLYTEDSKTSQSTLLLEHEKEQVARQRRCLNLRLASIKEETQEDTQELVMRFLREDLKVVEPGVNY
ncbi:hypothetical protein R1sor_018031 [Riccia sorocarpa]|uniref:Uncharacterized protein n=1 Tax=Riccia sorocarpa TaxID=122646 RepID=A0ABD3IES4_9MARC